MCIDFDPATFYTKNQTKPNQKPLQNGLKT